MFERIPRRRAVVTAILCALGQFALVVAILVAGKALLPQSAYGAVKLVAFATTVLLPIALAQIFGMWRAIGLGTAGLRSAGTIALCLVPALVFLSLGIHPPSRAALANDLVIQSFNAFGEELLFRGVIFLLLLRLSPVRSIVLNGLLFGAMHLIHGFMDGKWTAALIQSGVSTVAGMMFTALRYRTRSIWPPVIVHMLLNLAIMYSNVEPAAGTAALHLVERLADAIELAIAIALMAKIVKSPENRQPVAQRSAAAG